MALIVGGFGPSKKATIAAALAGAGAGAVQGLLQKKELDQQNREQKIKEAMLKIQEGAASREQEEFDRKKAERAAYAKAIGGIYGGGQTNGASMPPGQYGPPAPGPIGPPVPGSPPATGGSGGGGPEDLGLDPKALEILDQRDANDIVEMARAHRARIAAEQHRKDFKSRLDVDLHTAFSEDGKPKPGAEEAIEAAQHYRGLIDDPNVDPVAAEQNYHKEVEPYFNTQRLINEKKTVLAAAKAQLEKAAYSGDLDIDSVRAAQTAISGYEMAPPGDKVHDEFSKEFAAALNKQVMVTTAEGAKIPVGREYAKKLQDQNDELTRLKLENARLNNEADRVRGEAMKAEFDFRKSQIGKGLGAEGMTEEVVARLEKSVASRLDDAEMGLLPGAGIMTKDMAAQALSKMPLGERRKLRETAMKRAVLEASDLDPRVALLPQFKKYFGTKPAVVVGPGQRPPPEVSSALKSAFAKAGVGKTGMSPEDHAKAVSQALNDLVNQDPPIVIDPQAIIEDEVMPDFEPDMDESILNQGEKKKVDRESIFPWRSGPG